ncbi:protein DETOXIFICATION 16-like [Asparagus officinalis]|uniref:protein DETOXIFICATION 16-like n=1 Tax=Asparagus officinalis TaxID=4686 RepID=UPI00098E1F74|nr:protein DETOXIFICATION 16-like [Asparagus officinalis]
MEKKVVWAETSKQLGLAGPLILANVLQFILQAISVMFVGHLGELALSGASMAASFGSVTGLSVLMGMGSAMDTLCGQAFGAKQYHMLGIYMQRALIVLTLVSVPVAFVWAFTGQILIALHQDEQISTEAGLYARWMIPSLFGYGLLQCHIKFLQSQKIVIPLMICSGITTLLHILFCWVLVLKSSLGVRGAAIAISLSYWVNVLLLALYVKLSPACKRTWTGFSREALKDIPKFLKLAIPSAAMICLEFWSFEILVLLSGLLRKPKLETSVMSIILNTSSTVFMIAIGLGSAISTRVSNELGAGNPQAAHLAVYVVVSLSIIEGLGVGLVLILVRNVWGHAYSNEREVVRNVAGMMPFLSLSHFVNAIQCVLSGTARGCGWQKFGAIINLGSYYLVGIPSSVILAFVAHLGIKGLWIGIIFALFLQDVLYAIITVRTDWEVEVKKARERVYDSIVVCDSAICPGETA